MKMQQKRAALECLPEHPWAMEDDVDSGTTSVGQNGDPTQVLAARRQSAQASPLHAAAINGKKQEVASLLQEYKEEIDSGDHMGRTPLMYSILGDRYECALMLLKAGADLGCEDIDERTPLHWAAYQGNHKFVKVLLAKGADRNRRDKEGRTPLHLSTSHENVKVLQLLLRDMDTEDIDLADDHGMTALQWASFYGQMEHARLLIKAGATINCFDNERRTALHWASSNEDAAIAKLVLSNDFTILNCKDSGGRTSLHYAVGAGSVAVVRFLVAVEECSLNEQDSLRRTPLHWAAVLGNTALVEYLLDRGADHTMPDSNGVRALQYAAQNDFAETISAMLDYEGVTDIVDDNGRTSLMWAAGKGAFKALNVLVSHKHDVTAKDNSQTSALHMAAYGGHLACVEYLIENGAKVNAQDAQRYTPLFHACEMGHIEIVSYLLKNGASIELEDLQARSCLHIAALGGRVDICRLLIEAGINPGKGDILGRPPLHGASYGGFVACMKLLIDHGADVDALDKSGVSSLHWACACGSLDAVKLLISNKAFQNFMENKDDYLTPLDYAIVREHQDVAQFMIENNSLTIAGIQDLAATVIQSAWRGHYVRKLVKKSKALRGHYQKASPRHQTAAAPIVSDSDSVETKSSVHPYVSSKMFPAADKFERETSVDSSRVATHSRKKKFKALKSSYPQQQQQKQKKQELQVASSGESGTRRLRSASAHALSQVGYDTTVSETSRDNYRHRFSPSLNDMRYMKAPASSANPYDTRSVVSAMNANDSQLHWRLSSYARQQSSGTEFDLHSLRTMDLMSSNEDMSEYTALQERDWNRRRRTSDSSAVSYVRELSHSEVRPSRYRGSAVRGSEMESDSSEYPAKMWQTVSQRGPVSRSARSASELSPRQPYFSTVNGNTRRVSHDSTEGQPLVGQAIFNPADFMPTNNQDRFRRERARRDLIRTKVNAAVVIQRAVRRFLAKLRLGNTSSERQWVANVKTSNDDVQEDDIREIAALFIQLAWRKYVKRNLLVARRKQIDNRRSVVNDQLDANRLSASSTVSTSVQKGRSYTRVKSPSPRYSVSNLPVVPRAVSPRAKSPARKSMVEGLRMTPDGHSPSRRSPYSYNLVVKDNGRANRTEGVSSRRNKSPSGGSRHNQTRW